MKESITKFDLEAAFKALDEIEIPVVKGGIRANKPALTEIFSRKTKLDTLIEEYYDVNDSADLSNAKESREAEVAKAKLARIEKIVDLDAESPDDLLTSYVGKFIIQCPQCMTLFYKNPEDVEESEDDSTVVNVNEVCQHCGNDSGYTLVGKVGEATPEEAAEEPAEEEEEASEEIPADKEQEEPEEEKADEDANEGEDEDLDLDLELDALDLEAEDEESSKEEALEIDSPNAPLVEQLTEDADVSADDFEELINSPEFKKPISEISIQKMLKSEDDKMSESLIEDEEINPLAAIADELDGEVIDYSFTDAGEIVFTFNHNKENVSEAGEEIMDKLISAGYDVVDFNTNGRNIFIFKLADSSESLQEGILDNIKDKLAGVVDKMTSTVKTREAKADWILQNAREDYNNLRILSNSNELVPDEAQQKFKNFVVIGFKNTFSNGKEILSKPSFNSPDLVVGMKRPGVTDKYKAADDAAKGWSMARGNGPAFIYLAKGPEDEKAVFLCQYFKGELKDDQVEKYFNIIKKDIEAGKLLARSGINPEVADEAESANESLATIMGELEELQESTLETNIADTLIEADSNIAGFRLSECLYNEDVNKLVITGKTYTTSGEVNPVSYVFTEAYKTSEGKVELHGINKNLEENVKLVLLGKVNERTFITESLCRH